MGCHEITQQTRLESFLLTDKEKRRRMILDAWEGEMTAREVCRKLKFSDMNSVRPRITELQKMGYLVPVGKKRDMVTDRTVTAWRMA